MQILEYALLLVAAGRATSLSTSCGAHVPVARGPPTDTGPSGLTCVQDQFVSIGISAVVWLWCIHFVQPLSVPLTRP